ncbi:aminotransferase class III-fold pyridoxal phosphate-dependent enzyme [Bradyrhizobium murdochi]|uniref:aminotransferase class III-fold pyridoxal phosphate-dependent enzyme n=1 Tax=Bradyrhizobium murdochi TaxID=1038859 RepID=UPI001F33D0E8|nr:aminotransferase class III-fold pyridoxal phosphate-dependent enzyme [Bradyrhizobium murdochi]
MTVIVPPKGWLKAMRDTCRRLDILFVADEVITAFGRTGPMFACESEGVEPDLMTVAKGLTAGYAPMGAVLLSDEVYQGLAESGTRSDPIGHGQTYSAHPVSAAIGLEVLRLYREGGLLANAVIQSKYFSAGLDSLLDHPLVGDSRHRGLLGAVELVADKESRTRFHPSLNLPTRLFEAGYRNKVIFRAFGDNILGFAPALCITQEEVGQLVERVRTTLDDVISQEDVRSALRTTKKAQA